MIKAAKALVLIVCAIALVIVAPGYSAAQEKRISGDSWFGCTDKDYLERLIKFIVQKDKDAFSTGLTAGILTGKCTLFKAGEPVFLADTAFFSGLIKVRRKGDMTEYWTNIEAAK